jgi:predicted acylesterase/phospholipase RssA
MKEITNLVFSGAGTKIFIFMGYLKYLDEKNILQNINSYCGTSSGSIIALTLSIGYTISEIMELLIKMDFSKLKHIDGSSILNFFEEYGIDNSKSMERIFRIIIKAKVGNENITFRELYYKTNKLLVITATNLNKMDTVFFDHITTPDFKVIDAVLSSICVPFFYIPKKFDENYYVDGALTDNYPINYFKNNIENTLGLIIISNLGEDYKINCIEDYFMTVAFSSFNKLIKNTIKEYKDNTIIVYNDESLLNFEISLEKKYELINSGYIETEKFFNKNIEPPVSNESTESTQNVSC